MNAQRIILTLGLLIGAATDASGALTPLSVSANTPYLQNAACTPFFLAGDCPQNLPLKLAISEFDGYMAECAVRGFNLLWICIDGQRGGGGQPDDPTPKDRAGRSMMAQ